ncbi:ThiF family adenylyltransferase [Alkalibacillus aidingensis]|uniref:ThiF family adenylyltransferase n=1 Tax=Alkalibacillus aidingensis TaxID=2747607 RepID=UPI001CB6ED3D|nr:ThiF family adenylyltransferase [Alkalibacillus aidingensis]
MERYSRQILFQPINESGQQKILSAKVAVIGCGALGTAISETLTRAGVGELHLVDRDIVEYSNLQRQQLFSESNADEMKPKVEAARERLVQLNSEVTLYTYLDHAGVDLITTLCKRVDIIIDATDNFETRYMINDLTYKHGIPWIYGACVGSTSVVYPFIPPQSTCLRCLIDVIPTTTMTCDTAGIISPAVQITAARQCAEALKYITGHQDRMETKLQFEDVWEGISKKIGIRKLKNPNCPTCGEKPEYPSLTTYQLDSNVLCGRNTVQLMTSKERQFSLEGLTTTLDQQQIDYKRNQFFVQFYYTDFRIIAFSNGRFLFHGTKDLKTAKKVYHSLFG